MPQANQAVVRVSRTIFLDEVVQPKTAEQVTAT
jgi:hypothetical protein